MKLDIILLSYILVLIPLIISYKYKINIEKEIFKNSIRAFLQLTALGFILGYIFKIENYLYYLPIILIMILYAAYIAKNRTNDKYYIPFLSIFLSTFIILITLIVFNIISLKANEFIPIAGMIIGNSLNTYTLAIERLKRELTLQKDLIENMVSLGAPLTEAYLLAKKEAIKASLIPVNNTLQTIGIVSIPGITTGMLLAGANPLEAVSYQIVIIYMLVSINLFSSLFATILFTFDRKKQIFEG